MHYLVRLLVATLVAALCGCTSGSKPAAPENWLYSSIGDFDDHVTPLIERPDVVGVQVVVPWKMLERQKDKYDFTEVDRVLDYLSARNKKFFIQIQDRFFELPARLPAYLMTAEYDGGAALTRNENGLGSGPPGAVAAQWNPLVRKRFQSLLDALAQRYDGKIAGVNLPETAIEVDTTKDTTHFSCDSYFDATLDNAAHGRSVFTKSAFVQYINFWPCEWNNDHRYMERAFAFAQSHGVGLGGPDVLPNRQAQMDNSYPFFERYKSQLSTVTMAVQEPDFEYVSPDTQQPYTRQEFVDFAGNKLGAKVIFWATAAPWLHEN